jgi:transcriptional regulator with XRE-family HTH domain
MAEMTTAANCASTAYISILLMSRGKRMASKTEQREDRYPDIHRRFQQFLRARGLTQLAFSKELGVTTSAVTNYGRRNLIRSDTLMKMAEMYGLSLNWLLLGRGPMLLGQDASDGTGPLLSSATDEPTTEVPIVDALSTLVSSDCWSSSDHRRGTVRVPATREGDSTGDQVAFYIEDDDMAPLLRRGWLAVASLLTSQLPADLKTLHDSVVLVQIEGRVTPRSLHYTSSEWVLTAANLELDHRKRVVKLPITSPPKVVAKVTWWVGRQ